jgi:hypothetical protein
MHDDGALPGPKQLFGRALAVLAILWILLALLCWVFPGAAIRTLLASFAGCILLGGFGWYCLARWTGRAAQAERVALRKPLTVCVVAWLACLGTALTSAFARRAETDGPPSQPLRVPSQLFPDEPRRFLSELQEFDVTAGKWPFKKGDTGDGRHIIVGGVTSPHGLGMHPPWGGKYASAKYRLGMEAEVFKATVAVDDSTKWCWSPATFTVWGDGTELWRSKMISHDHVRSQECKVFIKGVNVLELRVHVENGNDGVHAVWFEPRILQTPESPDPGFTFELFKNGPREFLSDMLEHVIKTGPWPFAKNGDLGNGTDKIKVKGVPSPKGLGMAPPDNSFSAVSYRLDKQAALFKASVAIDDSSNRALNPAVFEVLGDGKSLWESQPIKRGAPPEDCSINVGGVVELELRVHAKPSHFGLHAVWIEPRLLKSADTPDK